MSDSANIKRFVQSNINILGNLIEKKTGSNPAGNTSAEFENDVFRMKAYCWCEGEQAGHEEGCDDGFDYKKGEGYAAWYKHANRGFFYDEDLSLEEWRNIFEECFKSLEDSKINTES
jgi:hypothetical protein